MADTKEKHIYFINNLILSAFENDEKVNVEKIREEQKIISERIDEEFKSSLENKKKKIKLDREELSEGLAYQSLLNMDYARGVELFARLIKEDSSKIDYKRCLAECLLHLGQHKIAEKYLLEDLLKEVDNLEITKTIGDIYFGIPEEFAKAIPYYEKLVQLGNCNPIFFYQLSFLYERVYQNKKLDVQIDYARKALEKIPDNNLIMAFLAKLLYRNGQKSEAVKYFEKMMKNNPTPEEIVLYSRLFMKEGDLKKAYDMYRVRFKTSNVAYPKELKEEKRWDGKKDLSDSTVILHYEQGFGDSVMFIRYLPRLAKLAKKVILVVQKNLIPILKSSGYDEYCEILSHEADISPNIKLKDVNSSIMYTTASGMSRIPHDYHIPMMDLPYLFDESPDKMYEAEGYLKVDENKVEEYRRKHIKNNDKIKIGISYHGTSQSNQTYRDISLAEFLPLMTMKNVEVYSFQADEYATEIDELPKDAKIYDLGRKFKNFEDTACAMSCMDLVVTTDNVVMNLAGALGIKTFGLFNVFSESRWYKTEGEDIGWYKSVKPFVAKDFNDWKPVIDSIKECVEKEFLF